MTHNTFEHTKTTVLDIDIKQLIFADWNYKTNGTPEQIQKLANSIERDGSPGVLAVREVMREIEGKEALRYEVIDGNHRLSAILHLAWTKIPCENFGAISKKEAILISHRRNHQWFETNMLDFSTLMVENIFPEYSMEELNSFMPDDLQDLESMKSMFEDFDWSDPDGAQNIDKKEASTGFSHNDILNSTKKIKHPETEFIVTSLLNEDQYTNYITVYEQIRGENINVFPKDKSEANAFVLSMLIENYLGQQKDGVPEHVSEPNITKKSKRTRPTPKISIDKK